MKSLPASPENCVLKAASVSICGGRHSVAVLPSAHSTLSSVGQKGSSKHASMPPSRLT